MEAVLKILKALLDFVNVAKNETRTQKAGSLTSALVIAAAVIGFAVQVLPVIADMVQKSVAAAAADAPVAADVPVFEEVCDAVE